MATIEIEGKTEEEAIQEALSELGLARDQVDVEVVSREHRGGILGFMGQPVVRVKVSEKGAADEAPSEEAAEGEGQPSEPAEASGEAEPVLGAGDEPSAEAAGPADDKAGEDEVPEPDDEAPDDQEETDEVVDVGEAAEEPVDDEPVDDSAGTEADAGPAPSVDDGSEPAQDADEADEGGEFGEDFDWPDEAQMLVQDVLDGMGLDITAEVVESDDEDIRIDTRGPDLGILIGRQGKTINAFQYLINVILNRLSEDRLRIVIDAEGYRERRERQLQRMARQAATRARRSGVEVRMEPLRAYERRLVHLAVQDDDSVFTYSEGEEPYRRVVIAPSEPAEERDELIAADQDSEGEAKRESPPKDAEGVRSATRIHEEDDFERRWIEEDEAEAESEEPEDYDWSEDEEPTADESATDEPAADQKADSSDDSPSDEEDGERADEGEKDNV